MNNRNPVKGLHLLCIAALIAVLTLGMAPTPTVLADGLTTTSDLAVRLISIPRHVRACQTFRATFSVTNYGPDPASHLYILVMLPDPFEVLKLQGAPESLAVGKTVRFSATVKVVAFVPGEPRETWIGIYAMSDPFPDISVDPNQENNTRVRNLSFISKPRSIACP